MGRNRKVECKICLNTMRSDILERHMKTHGKKSNGIKEAGSSGSGVCEKLGKHKKVECRICLKTMRSDHIIRHMKTHEKKTSGIDMVTRKSGIKRNIDEDGTNRMEASSEKCMNLEVLEKNVWSYVDEFNRKIEIGRNLKLIINKHGFNMHALPENMKEALKTYELYGKNMDMEDIKWRGWQRNLK